MLVLLQAVWLDHLPPAVCTALRGAPGSSASTTRLDLALLYCALYHANLLQVGGQAGMKSAAGFAVLLACRREASACMPCNVQARALPHASCCSTEPVAVPGRAAGAAAQRCGGCTRAIQAALGCNGWRATLAVGGPSHGGPHAALAAWSAAATPADADTTLQPPGARCREQACEGNEQFLEHSKGVCA